MLIRTEILLLTSNLIIATLLKGKSMSDKARSCDLNSFFINRIYKNEEGFLTNVIHLLNSRLI